MSRKNKGNPSADVTEAIANKAANTKEEMQLDDLFRVDEPSIAPAATTIGPVIDVAPLTYTGGVGSLSVGRRTMYGEPALLTPQQMAASRQAAAAAYAALPDEKKALYTFRVNPNGSGSLVAKPLQIEKDPLIQEVGSRVAEIKQKIENLAPVLTDRQKVVISKMLNRASKYTKGKKEGLAKPPSFKAYDKVLMRALEFYSGRRAAQLNRQARIARTQRMALKAKSKPIALANGQTVGINKRWLKKRATQGIIADAVGAAKVQAANERAALTARNKANRVAVATSHGRKVSKNDAPGGKAITRVPFPPIDANMPGLQVIDRTGQA